MTAPTLIFGWGNPSRGDDALGPALLDAIEARLPTHPEWGAVELLTDFQLQVEHALDLDGRARVLFVDASASALDAPFSAVAIAPARDSSFTSHALSPQGVMHVFAEMRGVDPPPCTLLAIAGEAFELGEPLSPAARDHLTAALSWTEAWLTGKEEAESPFPAWKVG
jgi:hydrogenase maturation protease